MSTERTYKIVTMVVPPGISAVSVQGYSLELVPAPQLGEGVHVTEVPMSLVQELKSHHLMTRDEWKAKVAAEEEKSEQATESLLNPRPERRKLKKRLASHAS